ncbi:hypothetical protein BO94DRAFT_423338, partial [Aspergillus sclerotioniger CBS 115572]
LYEFVSPSAPNLPSRREIEKLRRENGPNTRHLTVTHNGKKFFVKYNSLQVEEVRNQQFFFDQIAKRADSPIRIPEIYEVFETKHDGYIVMEHIDIDHFASDKQRSTAITELVTIEPPPHAPLGPIGGGLIRHHFFDFIDAEAPVVYDSVEDLESHINRVLKAFKYLNQDLQQVHLTDERLVCYYSDLYKKNFPVDKNGQLWVVDFHHAGVLPISFMSFTLALPIRDPIPFPYRNMIPIEHTDNFKAMRKASWCFKT